MGTVVVAECGCGYRSGDLCIGTGMIADPATFMYPAVCPSCRTVVAGNFLEKPSRCSRCGQYLEFFATGGSSAHEKSRDVFSWYDSDFHGRGELDFRLAPGPYRCPRCGIGNLKFSDVGFWD